ncbi:hypothetical protein [Brevibacillus migulae]|uniref:hypothetical protein n=1 Tax=Brevibacillus migulae TaxID=1644114 RepID=UPI00106E06B6|nr:hypothetical protein [Brevibacillus migulae]
MLEWMFVLYYLVVAVYSGILYRERGWAGSSLALTAVLIPFAGIILATTADKAAAKTLSKPMNPRRFEEILDISEQAEMINRVELQKELSVIPIEEALAIGDLTTRRRVILDALKEESLDLVSFLAKASRNEDSETSHYAVSAILEMKRGMLAELQRFSVVMERKGHDADFLSSYAAALKKYLGTGLMDSETERTYRYLQSEVLERLSKDTDPGEDVYAEWISCELNLGRYDRAEQASMLFLEKHPRSEMAYYMALKLYFTLRAGNRFQEVLELLKKSRVQVSHPTLQLIRYWGKGATYED